MFWPPGGVLVLLKNLPVLPPKTGAKLPPIDPLLIGHQCLDVTLSKLRVHFALIQRCHARIPHLLNKASLGAIGGSLSTMLIDEASRQLIKTVRHRPLVCAAVTAATALAAYLIWAEEQEENEQKQLCCLTPIDIYPGVLQMTPERRDCPVNNGSAEQRPSFTVTNEKGELRDSVQPDDEWSWFVNEDESFTRNAKNRTRGDALQKQTPTTEEVFDYLPFDVSEPSATATPRCERRRSKVGFKLDAEAGFYGFVFSYADGVCVAHGAEASHVGQTLSQIMESDELVHTLHARFIAAADKGGGFVSYEWRATAQQPLRVKGAYVVKLSKWGADYYAGVGYSVLPPRGAGLARGLYSFAFGEDGRCVAHGASATFVGLTLGEIMRLANNQAVDAAKLLESFERAAVVGGGWVAYPWRNSAASPLRQKGAYVTQHEAGDGRRLLVGVGFFGGECGSEDAIAPRPPPVPPSRAAARAATARLKRLLDETDATSAVATQALVRDGASELAAEAAEALCWDETELPAEVADMLAKHTRTHLQAFG